MVTPRGTPELFGREEPMRELFESLGTVAGSGALVLVTGEAGVGKTRLLHEFADRAGGNVVVARGTCRAGAAAYEPWIEALTHLSARAELLDDALPAGIRGELARLVDRERATPATAEEGAHRLFEAVIALLVAASRRGPVSVVVDDVEEIDPASRELLRYVAGNLRRVPVLLVVAYRPPGATQRDLVAHLGRLSVHRIALGPLAPDAAAALARACAARALDREEIDRVVRDSGGNPRFIEELVRDVDRDGVPAPIRDALLARIAALDVPTRDLLQTAAVIGGRVPRAWLAHASPLGPEPAARTVSAALDAGVLVHDGDEHLVSANELLRRTVLETLSPAAEAGRHRAIAVALERLAGSATELDLQFELARHWEAADEPDETLRTLAECARAAVRQRMYDAAADAYERAIAWWDRARAPEEAADCDRATLLVAAAAIAEATGRGARGDELRHAALAEPPPAGAAAVDAAALLLWSGRCTAGLYRYAIDALGPEAASGAARARALRLAASIEQRLHDGALAGDDARELTRLLDSLDAATKARAWLALGRAHDADGNPEIADQALHEAVAQARATGEPVPLVVTLAARAAFLVADGRPSAAIDCTDEIDGIVTRHSLRGLADHAAHTRVRAYALLGDLADARAALAQRRVRSEDRDARHATEAFVDLVAGDRAAAPALEAVGGVLAAGWSALLALRAEADSAEAARLARDDRAAAQAEQRARRRFERWQAALAARGRAHPLALAFGAGIDFELARLAGAPHAEAASVAGDRFDALGLRPLAAYFRWREGEARLDANDRAAGIDLLRNARAAAREHGYGDVDQGVTAAARRHQIRLGQMRPAAPAPDDALSERELEVLRLMVDGRSNPEIAAALVISRHTARAHVSNVLRKLGAASRAEAVATAHRRGII